MHNCQQTLQLPSVLCGKEAPALINNPRITDHQHFIFDADDDGELTNNSRDAGKLLTLPFDRVHSSVHVVD